MLPVAVNIRPAYSTKLRYAIKCASVPWFTFPAWFVATELSVSHSRWEAFAYGTLVLVIAPPIAAFIWAAHVADIPRPRMTWRQIGALSAFYSALLVGLSASPYFRYVYVETGATIVRVDRLTGSQCRAPFFGCGYGQPNDPLVRYDEKTGVWKAAPGGKTVRDLIVGRAR